MAKNSYNWQDRSKEAETKGVCHTEKECQEMYLGIPYNIRQSAVEWILEHYKTIMPDIADAQKWGGKDWFSPYHFTWGMGFRNSLRDHGMNESYFDVDNLDCIQLLLIEEAVNKWNYKIPNGSNKQ